MIMKSRICVKFIAASRKITRRSWDFMVAKMRIDIMHIQFYCVNELIIRIVSKTN